MLLVVGHSLGSKTLNGSKNQAPPSRLLLLNLTCIVHQYHLLKTSQMTTNKIQTLDIQDLLSNLFQIILFPWSPSQPNGTTCYFLPNSHYTSTLLFLLPCPSPSKSRSNAASSMKPYTVFLTRSDSPSSDLFCHLVPTSPRDIITSYFVLCPLWIVSFTLSILLSASCFPSAGSCLIYACSYRNLAQCFIYLDITVCVYYFIGV